jgi:hypothetical protein
MAFFQLLIILVIILSLLCISVWVIKSKILSALLLAIFISPLLFINNLMRRYTRKVLITLSGESFSVEVLKKTDSYEREGLFKYELNELGSYKIQFPNRRFAAVVFNLKPNRTVEYSFYKKKIDSEQSNTDDLIESFHKLISDYNNRQPEDKKIPLLPSFYASKYGLYSIIGLVIFFSIAIVIHIIYNVKTLPISLFLGFSMIIQIALKRKTDMDFYKKMK